MLTLHTECTWMLTPPFWPVTVDYGTDVHRPCPSINSFKFILLSQTSVGQLGSRARAYSDPRNLYLAPSSFWPLETTEANPGLKCTLPHALCTLFPHPSELVGRVGWDPDHCGHWPWDRPACLGFQWLSFSHSSLQVGERLWECISSDQGACPASCFFPSAQPGIFPSAPPSQTPRVSLTCAGCVREGPVGATKFKGTPSPLP